MRSGSGIRARLSDNGEHAADSLLCFEDFELDFAKAELRRAGDTVPLSALSLALLAHLVRHRERVIGGDELLAEVWHGVAVSSGSLRQAVWELRQALDDGAGEQRLIRTVRGRGYRFVGRLRDRAQPAPEPARISERRVAASKTYFGRTQELARLELVLEEAVQGSGRSCTIVGPPGIGKSRLARELVRAADARGLLCVEGHCDPDGFAPAFWPWTQLLEPYLACADAQQQARYRALSPLGFRLLLGAERDPLAGPELDANAPDRFALLEELGRLFAALLAERPGMLLLEDLQWADESSLVLLTHVVRLLPRTASLLVITCRDLPAREHRALARALEAVNRSALSELIPLGNLSLQEVTAMIEAHTQGEVPRSLCADVHELSHGNPLFALELARLLARSGHAAPLTHEKLEVQSVIRRRLLGLPERAQQALRAASALSPEFALAELAGVLDEPPHLTLERLDECIEHGVLTDADAAHFRFAHPLMRESAYGALPRAERARLHRLAGEWIERHAEAAGSGHLNELAHHFFAAAPNQSARKAVHYALRCAELACASAAYADALSHYDRALCCVDLDATISAAEKLEIELLRGEALRASGADTTRVNAYFLALSERAQELGDPLLFARAALGYTGQHRARYSPPRFMLSFDAKEAELLERALAWLGEQASDLRALLLCSLTYCLISSTDRERRERLAAEAISLARELKSPGILSRALATRVYCCAAPDDRDARAQALDELITLTHDRGLKVQEVDALVTRATNLLSVGDAVLADRDTQRAIDLARELNLPQINVRSEVPSLLRAFAQGDLEEAERLSRRALDSASHDLWERAVFMVRMATLLMLRQGLKKETLAGFETACTLYPDVLGLRCLLASLYAQCEMTETAERYFDEVARDDFKALPEDMHWLSEMTQLACAAVFLDDPARAAQVYARLLPYGHIFDFLGGQGCPAGPVAYWLGELAKAIGDYAAADRWFDIADELNQRLGAVLFMQYTAVSRAKLLFIARPHESARAHNLLRGAIAFAERTGTGWLRLTAEAVARDMGKPRRPRTGAGRLRALR